ncbi:hypothetical protein Psuf_056580 [Phytohabitans suffuscus]|uniref:Uncharacterized protein n=1 Tax=Phytohabitans suffuscus TaxID=624315 RepID=A0A6F8YQ86_9ACTN|nr:hypothetical protein Psuf_056580 [Phytohabitans suffuscus]
MGLHVGVDPVLDGGRAGGRGGGAECHEGGGGGQQDRYWTCSCKCKEQHVAHGKGAITVNASCCRQMGKDPAVPGQPG